SARRTERQFVSIIKVNEATATLALVDCSRVRSLACEGNFAAEGPEIRLSLIRHGWLCRLGSRCIGGRCFGGSHGSDGVWLPERFHFHILFVTSVVPDDISAKHQT